MSKQSIFKAMGSFAYAIAIADGKIQDAEKETVRRLALSEFDITDIDNAMITKTFKELEDRQISLEEAYQYGLDTLESTRFSFDFDPVMKIKCIKFIERTADAFEGVQSNERVLLNRLKRDLTKY